MTLVIDYRFVLFMLVLWKSDANVNIFYTGTETTRSNFECGTKLVLTCQIDSFSSIMTWENDSSIDPLAQCTRSSCDVEQTLAGRYNISANVSAGIFNLTIFQVTFENNNATYICAYGSDSDSFQVIVKDYEPTLNENTPGIIDVSSGCIDNNTEVKFKWEKSKKANLNREIDYQEFQPTNYTNSFNVCLGDSNCEPSQFIKKSYSISIGPGGKDDFRIRAKLTYDGSVVKYAYTNGRYKVKDGGSHCSIKCDTVCDLLIAIGVCLAVIVGFLLLYVMLILCPPNKDDSTEDKWDTTNIEILLNTAFAILWIVIVILFICSLLHCCSCDDSCYCCKIVLILGIVLGILCGIHVILWLIFLCVLYERKDKKDGEGNICFKTKLMKVRRVFSTIPIVGIFPVCRWLIRIYRYGNRTIHDDKLTSEKNIQEWPSVNERYLTENRTEDDKKQPQKRFEKGQDKINQFLKRTIDFGEDHEERVTEDQLSASDITIVKPKGTDTKNSANKQKCQNTKSAPTHAVTTQLSQNKRNNRNVLTRSQGGSKGHEKPDNQDHSPHFDENSQRKIDETNKQSGYKNKADSKDGVKPKIRKSRKEANENKSTKTTEFVITDAPTRNTKVTTTGSNDPPESGDDDNPSHISKSDNSVPNRKKSRKNKNEKQGPNDTKPLSAESHNGNIQVTKIWSDDQPDSGDDDSPSNISKSDNTVPYTVRKKSRKNKNEKQGSNNTKPLSAESHIGSEPMKRALSANFDDKNDTTTTVSIDSDTKM